jgi:hypothetical protein
MTKSKLQMEYNKKVTSSAPGLLYVFFGSFVSDQRFGKIAGNKSKKSIIH